MTNINAAKTSLIYCTALGALGSAAVLLAAGFTATALGLAVVLLLAGGGLGYYLAGIHTAQGEAVAGFLDGQSSFAQEVVPVWKRHFAASIEQMDSAVNQLSERFGGIVDKLDVALRTATQETDAVEGKGSDLITVFTNSGQDLRALIARQQQSMHSMEGMLTKVQGLDRFIV